ncbi:restriction endonuclease subunit S [Acetobacter oryzifermentans]|uniref:restriction endonuclease subunit S n=1 Tax=Acetobacter oryzifermentans TaxID=1633874 RepID=UPI00346497CB
MGGSGQQRVKNTTNLTGWALRSFYDLARITSGQVDPREEPYRAMVLVAPDHIQTGSGRIDQRSTAEQQGAISGKYLVKNGEIIYSKIRPNLQKLAVATEDCLCSADMYPVEARENISSIFLKYLMLSAPFTEFATSVSVRSGMPKINREELAYFSALVPENLKEQEAIAEALSDADALIEGLERLIAKKRLIKQGAMQELLTGRRRLPGFSEEWIEHKLSEISSFGKGKGLPKSDVKLSGDIPCIHYGSLFREQPTIIESLKTFTFDFLGALHSQAGEVLMPTSDVTPSGLAVASCILSDGVLLGGDILIIRPHRDRLDGRFLASYIRQDRNQIMELVSGTTVFHIYSSDMARFKIKLPPLDEQQSIVSLLTDMDAEIQALESRLKKAHTIKEGMMQNLLTGRIRLV